MADVEDTSNQTWKKIARAVIPFPQHSILAIMTFLGVVIAYAMRVCLHITIISIVEPKQSKNNGSRDCPFPEDYTTGNIDKDPIYKWDETLTGHILSSFYFGYVITHIPGGVLSDVFGGKHVLNGCVLVTTICTLLTPVSITKGGPYLLIVVRVVMGSAQGVLYPAVSVLLASWIPQDVRAFYGAMVYSSSQVGVVLANTISGNILHHHHSWSLVYYIFGIMGCVWVVLFILMCTSDPQVHPYISKKERDMLTEKIGIIKRAHRIQNDPWIEILTNIPVVSLVITQCGHDLGFFVMINHLPKYLSDVLHYNIKTNGYLSAMPFIAMFVISGITGLLADYIIRHDRMKLVNCRILFTVLATFFPSLGMILASYAGCDRTLVMIAFTIGMGTMGFYYSGQRVNALDLSPRFAGTVMAYANGVGAIFGALAPIIVGVLTPNTTVVEYRIAFWITFVVMNGTGLVYVFLASGDIQPFNDHVAHGEPK